MAKPNYSFEKKQRELAKKKKQDEKLAKKQSSRDSGASEGDQPSNQGSDSTPASGQ